MTATRPLHRRSPPPWEPYTLEYGWLRDIGSPKPFGDPTPIQRDYTKEEFWTEAAPAVWSPACTCRLTAPYPTR